MRLNERWIWLDETASAAEAGILAYASYPGAWWLGRGNELAGPFEDAQILRALRVACTPVIDGCEKGPAKSGFLELPSRRPRAPRWKAEERYPDELPPSVTVYDEAGLAPAVGCCTRFDAPPRVTWKKAQGWEPYLSAEPARGGVLERGWNAHPPGSLAYCDDEATLRGLTIVDR